MNTGQVNMPQSYTVFQRSRMESGHIPLDLPEGTEVRLLAKDDEIIPWQNAGASLEDVPVGGPYTLEARMPGEKPLRAKGLLMGDLWVMAGQSNMDGSAKLVDLEPPSATVHCFYYNEKWDIARDPVCKVLDSIDPVHWTYPENFASLEEARAWDMRFREHGASCAIRFGKDLYKATGVPVGLIVCSHGGTSMEQWDPAKKREGANSLYGSTLRRVQACGGRIAGMLWYQGESNANPDTGPYYKERMQGFIESVRQDLDNPSLPVLMAQLSRFYPAADYDQAWWDHVQQCQLELAQEMEYVGLVATIDATLSDPIHLDALSERKLGARLAMLATPLLEKGAVGRQLTPKTINLSDDRTEIGVRYRDACGALAPSKNVWGFVVEDAAGPVAILATRAKGDRVTLTLERAVADSARLWYGKGCNPTTNLRDKRFAAPVFGPFSLDPVNSPA